MMSYHLLHCTGPDARTFLQGQLSCDINEVTSSKLTPGCLLNLKGRVVALVFLFSRDDNIYIIIPQDMAEKFTQHLKKYMVFSKAELTDITDTMPIYPTLTPDELKLTDGIGFSLNAEDAAEASAFQAALIEAHIPHIGLEQSEQFLPHDIGLVKLGAISFKKGCFVGQEIVARMEHRGKLKKHLAHRVCAIDAPDSQAELVNQVSINGQRSELYIES